MRNAGAPSSAGKVAAELGNSLHFGADLVDTAEVLQGLPGAAAPLADIETLRSMLRSARGLLGGKQTLL